MPELAKNLQTARQLAPFADDMAWQALRRKFEEQKESLLHRIARRLLGGDKVDQVEIDFHRGYFKGVEDFINDPDRVIANLETAARIAYLASGEEYNQEGGA